MAISEMRKLHLVAMANEKDALLNALGGTRSVEITNHSDVEYARALEIDAEGLKEELISFETALEALSLQVESQDKETGVKSAELKDGFDVTYSEFMSAEEKGEEMRALVKTINGLIDEKNRLKNELVKAKRALDAATIYGELTLPFSYFTDTAKTRVRLGTVASGVREACLTALLETELCVAKILVNDNENALLFVATHKSEGTVTDGILSSFGFSEHAYPQDISGAALCENLRAEIVELERLINENGQAVYALKANLRPLKIYCDYLAFTLEKRLLSEKMRGTDKTFLLEAFVPKTAEEFVRDTILNTSKSAYIEFTDPLDTDEPPTLLKNNPVVESFESITNIYSPPNYREFDPNAVMSFFYSLFMGFIIGDWGYGVLMLLGFALWYKGLKRPTGLSRLAGAFACGGIFAIVWGMLFNSFFGAAILPKTVMPNPQSGRCLFVGIEVPSVLFFAMLVGVIHLCVAYLCKAAQCFFRKEISDGILDGIIWAVFSIGVIVLFLGLAEFSPAIDPDYPLTFNMPILRTVGGIIAGGSLLIAVVTAGRKEKFIGKFTKGFGSLYGIINYVSDILSYARLYGLMLSGAVIAGIISTYGVQFMVSGNILMAVLGVVILLAGHAFNLVMNLLGAYIHDARLQYVEFYGKFYEGEGELFSPLGSNRKYVYLLPNGAEK